MPLFEAKHLHKRFGDAVVLEDISLSFDEGRLSGIMGPNGAGKTKCFNVLTGRYKPDRGEVRFDDRVITGATPRAIARLGISRSFQVMNLFNDYTALDNVLVALPAVRRRGFDAWSDLGSDSGAQDEAAAVLARVAWPGASAFRQSLLTANAIARNRRGLAGRACCSWTSRPGLGTGTARLSALIANRTLTIVVIGPDLCFCSAWRRISVIH
jgi:branched-chain amino acid transport system ATP-binding protein